MKKVLITGGSRGIGKACVEYFSENGWKVFFTYIKSEEEAKSLTEKTGAVAIHCDISISDEINKIEEEINKFGGYFDAIVNNAGIAEQKLFTEITEEDWDNIFNVNIKGMFLVTSRFIKPMISKKCGSIINISSIWGLSGGSCEVHYAASKSAVIGFTKALADEMGPSNITVNCLAPGVIDTDMNSHLSFDDIEALKEQTPLGRIGMPKDIAEAAFFLADKGEFITGEVIKISGGF